MEVFVGRFHYKLVNITPGSRRNRAGADLGFLRGGGPTFFFFAPENLKIAPAENLLSRGGGGGGGGTEHILFLVLENFKICTPP